MVPDISLPNMSGVKVDVLDWTMPNSYQGFASNGMAIFYGRIGPGAYHTQYREGMILHRLEVGREVAKRLFRGNDALQARPRNERC